MNADVTEAGNIQAEEPGAVSILDGAFAIPEIVGEASGIEEFVDLEGPFRGFVVSTDLLGAEIPGQGAAVFLASSASDFVNGHILYVDGGILAYIGKQP